MNEDYTRKTPDPFPATSLKSFAGCSRRTGHMVNAFERNEKYFSRNLLIRGAAATPQQSPFCLLLTIVEKQSLGARQDIAGAVGDRTVRKDSVVTLNYRYTKSTRVKANDNLGEFPGIRQNNGGRVDSRVEWN